MAYEELFENPQRVKKAVMFYERKKMPDDPDVFFCQEQPYKTLNLLMMEGNRGEYVRICEEGQKPNGLYIRRWEKTLEVMTDIFTAQCAYACRKAAEGQEMPGNTKRGERGVNFEMMQELGATFAYTSTSKNEARKTFVEGKMNPHLLTFCPAPGIPYLDYEDFLGDDYSNKPQREILLPPMARITWQFRGKEQWHHIDDVCFYDVQLTGYGMPLEFQDEQKLLDHLAANATRAARGLEDIVRNRAKSVVLGNPRHPYWQWKRNFRQLVLQRMQAIYKEFYGE